MTWRSLGFDGTSNGFASIAAASSSRVRTTTAGSTPSCFSISCSSFFSSVAGAARLVKTTLPLCTSVSTFV